MKINLDLEKPVSMNTYDERFVMALEAVKIKEPLLFKKIFYSVFIFFTLNLKTAREKSTQTLLKYLIKIFFLIKEIDFIQNNRFLKKAIEWTRFLQALSMLFIVTYTFIDKTLRYKFKQEMDRYVYFEPSNEQTRQEILKIFNIPKQNIFIANNSIFVNLILLFRFLKTDNHVSQYAINLETNELEPIIGNIDTRNEHAYFIIKLEILPDIAKKYNFQSTTCDIFLKFIRSDIFIFTRQEHIPLKYLVKLFQQQVFKQYSSSLINITEGNEGGDCIFQVIDIETPELYDEELLAKIKPMCINALDRKQKLGFILYGKHGVSKTQTIYKLLKDLNVLNFTFKNANMAHAFLQSINGKKILLLEDIDTENHKLKTENFPQLLKLLDSDCYDILIMSTNSNEIDPSLMRPGRCDKKISCKLPDTSKREKIIKKMIDFKYKNVLYDQKIIEQTDGFTHAELNALVRLTSLADTTLSNYLPLFNQEKNFNLED